MRIEKIALRDITLIKEPRLAKKGVNNYLFFTLLFAYQIIFIFQGIDVGDSGSYAAYYQQIFKNPETVQYNFVFWLSGILGGLYVYILPDLGLLGMRIAGVIVSILTILTAYNLLKKYLSKGNLQLSLFILTLFVNNNPKELSYNNLSSLLYLIVIYFLFTGLRDKKPINIFLSGVFVSLNVFNRLPNILGIGIMAGIFLYGYYYHVEYKKQLKDCILFLLGFFASSAIIILIMYWLGHLQLYINSVKIIFAMGKQAKQVDGTDSAYGIARLIQLLYWHYKFSILCGVSFFFFVLFVIPVVQKIKEMFPFFIIRIIFSKYLFLSLLCFLIVTMKIDNISILYFFTGISLTSAAAILVANKNKEISLLLFLGCFFAVIHPIGSSTGIWTVIIYSLWIAFPIAFEYILNIRRTNFGLKIFGSYGDLNSSLSVDEKQLDEVKKLGIGIAIFACLYYSYYYPHFDKRDRMDMHYSINNKFLRGIYTSQDRATALNELLAASSKYIKPNDYVLAYDCIPMYHYLTETRPYMRNPWPWIYPPDVFKLEQTRAMSEIHTLPVVVFQIIRTQGHIGGKWPDYSSKETILNWDFNDGRNAIMEEFLKTNHYKEVWTNKAFKIFIPDNPVGAQAKN